MLRAGTALWGQSTLPRHQGRGRAGRDAAGAAVTSLATTPRSLDPTRGLGEHDAMPGNAPVRDALETAFGFTNRGPLVPWVLNGHLRTHFPGAQAFIERVCKAAGWTSTRPDSIEGLLRHANLIGQAPDAEGAALAAAFHVFSTPPERLQRARGDLFRELRGLDLLRLGAIVVDVGSGTGHLLDHLAGLKLDLHYVAVEENEHLRRLALLRAQAFSSAIAGAQGADHRSCAAVVAGMLRSLGDKRRPVIFLQTLDVSQARAWTADRGTFFAEAVRNTLSSQSRSLFSVVLAAPGQNSAKEEVARWLSKLRKHVDDQRDAAQRYPNAAPWSLLSPCPRGTGCARGEEEATEARAGFRAPRGDPLSFCTATPGGAHFALVASLAPMKEYETRRPKNCVGGVEVH